MRQTNSKPTTDQVREWHDTTWMPYVLSVAGVDLEEERTLYPTQFPDGIDDMLVSFVKDTGRLPHGGEELDAYANSAEEWATYRAIHGLTGKR